MHDVEVVKVEDTDEPRLDPEGAIIEVAACGICGTDARTFFNGDPRAPAPWVLGHEPVGIVVEVGEGARLPAGVEKGARVFLGSILTCGECAWCADGLENLCEREELYGYSPHPGAYAEYAAVPPIATKNLIALPPELPSDLATVADPFACALNGAEVLDTRYGDTVTIIGAGPIGCWQSVLARDRGAQGTAGDRPGGGGAVRRRRLGGRRGQRRGGAALPHRRGWCRPGHRGGTVEAGAAGRTGHGGQAGPARLLRRPAQGRSGEPARHEPAALQGAHGPGVLRLHPAAIPHHD